MRFQPLLGSIGLTLCFLWLVTGCNVQDIIPAEVDPPRWFLSPSGDKLLYNTREEPERLIVRFLATGQDVTIATCPWFIWLDDETVYCYEYQSPHDIPVAIISNISASADGFPKIPVKAVTTDQVELDTLLKQAKAIYQLQNVSDSLLILDTRLQENTRQYYHLIGVENLDEVLKNYHYTPIPLYGIGGESFKKIYSPNKAYYSLLKDGLGIYDATNDRLLTEVKLPTDRESFIQIGGFYPNQSGGWAADSSGVYFQIYQTIGLGPRPPVWPVQKLCVPGASGCSAGM